MGILSAFRFAFQNLFFTPVLYGVIASLAIFSATWEKGDRLKDRLTDPFRSQHDSFDFIIVGGGSAGSVLAYRLSKHYTVLLLEAGGESHPFQAIPALSFFITNYPATDWSHKSTIQQTTCLACKDKRFTFSQGKNLGGSGNLNYMIHLRGHHKDFDNWHRITGDHRLSYDGVLQDFVASEHFVGTTTDAAAHGVGGPMQIEMPNEIGLANEWNWAGQEMGYPHVDLNGRYDEGFDAIYYPAGRRKSLEIRKFAHVNKILIRDEPYGAYGVQYDRHGVASTAFANKEVIISAGTLQTPKILMLSGIGPRDVLEPFQIPVKVELPVGKGLQDHVSTLLGPFFINSKKPFSYDEDVTPRSFFQFTTQGTGPLTTSGFQATALLTSSYAKARGQDGWPDLQLTLFGISPHRLFDSDLAHAFGLKPNLMQRYFFHARERSAFFILISVARPESQGEVCIRSKDPTKPLIISPNYFTDPMEKDMKVMIEGINRALFLAENTTVFRNCGVRFTEKCFPGCEGYLFRSDSYWECYIRHMTVTLNDHTGSAQMGFQSSPYAVVDPELKVMGVENLRIVDASVMPTIVVTNVQAATIMIAEKASQLIMNQWKNFGPVINYDQEFTQVSGPPTLPQYGPPSSEQSPQYGPPPLQQTPQAGYPGSNEQRPVSGGVVVDDSLDSLTPPGLPEQDPYFHPQYDNLELLRNQGLEAIQQINLASSGVTKEPERNIPLPAVTATLHPLPYSPTTEDYETTPVVFHNTSIFPYPISYSTTERPFHNDTTDMNLSDTSTITESSIFTSEKNLTNEDVSIDPTTTIPEVILSDIDLTSSNKNESLPSMENHPIVPVDMDPLPKIIARTTPRSTNTKSIIIRNAGRRVRITSKSSNRINSNSEQENISTTMKSRMAKFVRRKKTI